MTSPRTPRPASVESSRRLSLLRSAIRRMARQIVEAFDPDRIVLFGSHAYGLPTSESDVDILVVMPTTNPVGQACRIRLGVEHPFPLDLLVRPQEELDARLRLGDSFWRDVLSRGKVLYEKADRRMGTKSRGRLRVRKR